MEKNLPSEYQHKNKRDGIKIDDAKDKKNDSGNKKRKSKDGNKKDTSDTKEQSIINDTVMTLGKMKAESKTIVKEPPPQIQQSTRKVLAPFSTISDKTTQKDLDQNTKK